MRRSTLQRLQRVPAGAENLAVGAGGMSFADLARHLIDADGRLECSLREPGRAAMHGRAGSLRIADRAAWRQLLEELEASGGRRQRLLAGLEGRELVSRLSDEGFGGQATVWWIVVRGNLEHEAHHCGQIAAGLREVGAAGS